MGGGGDNSDQQHVFDNYTTTTVDPGQWLLPGTVLVCIVIVIASLAFLILRRRRRRRRKAKQQQQQPQDEEQQQGPELSFKDTVTAAFSNYFEKRRTNRNESRLSGWRSIFTTVEEKSQAKSWWNRSPEQRRKPFSINSVLHRDLLEDGGIVDHIMGGTVCGKNDGNKRRFRFKRDDESSDSDNDSIAISPTPSDRTDNNNNNNKDGNGILAFLKKKVQRKKQVSTWDYLVMLAQYDKESRSLLKLAIPYSMAAVNESIFNVLTVAVIGHFMGTYELTAYITVYYAIEIGTMLLSGLLESVPTLCSQAIGTKNYYLAGQYVQLCVVLYELMYLPQIYFWWNYVDDLMLWMSFDKNTAYIAQDYAKVCSLRYILTPFHSVLAQLLDVTDYENFNAVSCAAYSVTHFGALLGLVYFGQPTLMFIGNIELLIDAVILFIKAVYVKCKGWIDKFLPGMFTGFALSNWSLVKIFMKTAVPLSLGYVLSYGEWEALFVLAAAMGPAEVATWGLLGEIWGAIESLTYAWGDAAEVRGAFLLGAGMSEKAELSAHKSLYMGTMGAIIASGVLMALSSHIPIWLTTDETLQNMIEKLIPPVAVGNIAISIGSISFQLLGSQSRYALATAVLCIGSWFVTIPLAIISTLALNWDLQGMVAAVVIGYTVSGMMNFVIVCCTRWDRTSAKVIRKNAKVNETFRTDSSTKLDKANENGESTKSLQSEPSSSLLGATTGAEDATGGTTTSRNPSTPRRASSDQGQGGWFAFGGSTNKQKPKNFLERLGFNGKTSETSRDNKVNKNENNKNNDDDNKSTSLLSLSSIVPRTTDEPAEYDRINVDADQVEVGWSPSGSTNEHAKPKNLLERLGFNGKKSETIVDNYININDSNKNSNDDNKGAGLLSSSHSIPRAMDEPAEYDRIHDDEEKPTTSAAASAGIIKDESIKGGIEKGEPDMGWAAQTRELFGFSK